MTASLGVLLALLVASPLLAQTPAKVDFGRDVQPIFQAQCISCHGPEQQMNGFRLDQRSAALRGGTFPVITPFNSAGSRLYIKLLGQRFGQQMPPTGKLADAEIEIIKNWLDQGAEWPDAFAGEGTSLPLVPESARIMAALRAGNQEEMSRALAVGGANGVGMAGGWTPLMYAALYGSADTVKKLLGAGASPNAATEKGTTALMLAVHNADSTRALLQAGANPNPTPEDGRTPLVIAASRVGTSAAVKLLLEAGADPKVLTANRTSALRLAAGVGQAESMRLLIAAGADLKADAAAALNGALAAKCRDCVEQVIGNVNSQQLAAAYLAMARVGDVDAVQMLFARGVDVNARDGAGRTALMSAANGDAYPLELVRLLLARGADATLAASNGDTAASIAAVRGGPLLDMLVHAGATAPSRQTANTLVPALAGLAAREAVQRALPLLQKADATFLKKSGCVSCHNDSLTAQTIALARTNGFTVDEAQVTAHKTRMVPFLEGWRESALHGIGIPGGQDTVGYVLYGMLGAQLSPDAATDAMAFYLRGLQLGDGHWRVAANRPPMESSDIEVTAVALRVMKEYAPAPYRAEYAAAAQAAAGWLATARPVGTEDRAFQLLGLVWGQADKALISRLAHDLIKEQRGDGGWAPIGPSGMSSDAYATGEALTALREAGIATTDDSYAKGVRFLLGTERPDGSWYVHTRAQPVQAYFESDFPHGPDQFISAAATNWALQALIPVAAREPAAKRSN